MSFGTGEHQTTKIVIQLFEKYLKTKDKVLDVGSGTSLLGIAASKLGASSVVAVDNDEWCYINGKENAERNEIENIDIIMGTIDDVNASILISFWQILIEMFYSKLKKVYLIMLNQTEN